ncbi:hypothetical protein ABTY98_40120 [Streptomyces sp. NPDC096040]|uniref:hypothetical protein n=1 Tax=Streptomyces sp. NPDC096040 TaxID=3155541 RepID=UPI00331CCA33
MAPVFEHADKLFALLHSLVRRPKKGEFPEATEGQDGLPVVMLVGYEESELAELAETIDKTSCKEAQPPRIPHKLIDVSGVLATMNDQRPDLEGDWRRAELYRRVLVELAMEFASPSNSPDARVQFRRFGLVNWLLETNNTADPLRGQPDHELLMRLQTRELQRRGFFRVLRNPTTEVALEGRAPWWAWILGLHVLPVLWFRAWRAVGPEYRWLLRQPYMAPRDPGTFAGFALRLTQPRFEHENPEQVGKLLVNAFLEDLRVAYRRRIWRRRAWRRTTYCVALLKGVKEDNFGRQLIRSLIEVRIETGDFDPLLVIGTSQTHDYAGPQWGQLEDDLVMNWGAQFVAARRGRSAEDWYLPVRIPATLDPGTDAYTRHSKNLLPKLQFRPEPSPRWARRRVTALAVVLAVALVAGAVGWRLNPAPAERWEQQHCKLPRTDPDAATVETRGAECVGVAPHGFAFGSQDESLKKTLKKIDEQNRAAEEMHHDAPDRPIVTLVHLSALLSSPGKGKAAGLLSYAREALQGVASAQKRQLNRTGSDDPLLRVLPASAGLNMQYGPEVVDMIAKMMRTDPTIVGVTGLDQSRKATITTIHRLTRIGLPMVATTLSADTLPEASPLYYQVSPQNRREAAVAAAYGKHLVADSPGKLKPRVRVVYSADPTDEYSSNLRADAATSFHDAGFEVEQQAYKPASPSSGTPNAPGVSEVGAGTCHYPGLIFFAGRSEDFDTVLSAANDSCGSSDPPTLLAGDDIARLAANPDRRGAYPRIPYDFLDFTQGVGSCDEPSDLYTIMQTLFPDECNRVENSSLDGHAALAFDAVNLYLKAVTTLPGSPNRMPITPGAVWKALGSIHGDSAFDGESGSIDFGGVVDRQVPLDKLISVQRVQGPKRPKQMGFCGVPGRQHQNTWCPESEAVQAPADALTAG